MEKSENNRTIKLRNWLAMGALAIVGQLAWAVENSWFNKFVADKITPDPRPIAWMVAASAIVAAFTSIFMGTWSDRACSRWGKRKPFILIGYGLWGVMTAVFPLTATIKHVGTAVLMVVLIDCVMTFFGSTANDAAFNAWTADITPTDKRGRVEGLLNFCLFVAQLISYTAAGMLIESKGYFIFFYALGGIVTVIGVIASLQIQEPSSACEPKPSKSYWQEIGELFNFRVLLRNKELFILLIIITIAGIGFQVSFPYLLIYVTNTLAMPLSSYSVIGGAMLVGSAVLAIPLGFLAEKINRKWLAVASLALSGLGYFLFSQTTQLVLLALFGVLWLGMNTAFAIVSMAWLKDLLPVESRGRFLGVRMIFAVMLPMIFGPMIGQALIRQYGIPTTLGAEAGFLPVPIIFVTGAIITLFAIIPVFLMNKKQPDLPKEA